jgi:curved DNA-binding protein
MANSQNLYETLGVEKGASADAIRKHYRKLARKLHPDVNPDDAKAAEKFKLITAAYEVLSDEKKRAAYDEFGDAALSGNFNAEQARAHQQWEQAARGRRARGGGGAGFGGFPGAGDSGGWDLNDLFGRSRGPTKGHDLHAAVDLELRQAIEGTEVSLELPEQGSVRVRIPPGADTGSTIRIPGKGASGQRGGARGDLIIETTVRPHPRLRRENLDLHLRLPVTLDEAYNGASVEVPTFDGPVMLKIPARAQAGAKLRLRGKGITRKDTRGDFYVELDVRMPDKADDALAEALKASTGAYSAPVRGDLTL